jgi:anti-sigma B factor antagonist
MRAGRGRLEAARPEGESLTFEVGDHVEANGVRVLAVLGELDLQTADQLERLFPQRFSFTAPAVIDLSECGFIDSSGIAVLVRGRRRAVDDGHPGLVLVAPPGTQPRRVLELVGLDSRLRLLDSRAEAFDAVSDPPLVVPDPGRDGRPPSRNPAPTRSR